MINLPPPYSLEAEQCILGYLLNGAKEFLPKFSSMGGTLEYFYDIRHAKLFELLIGMDDCGRPIDSLTLSARAKELNQLESLGGMEYLGKLATLDVINSEHFTYWFEILRQHFIKRHIAIAAIELTKLAHTEGDPATTLEAAQQRILSLSLNPEKEDYYSASEASDAAIEYLEKKWNGESPGINTGIYELDRLTRGLRPGQLIVIAARPGMGKTSLAMNIIERVAIDDKLPVFLFSLEVTIVDLSLKIFASRSGVSIYEMENNPDTAKEIREAVGAYAKANISLSETIPNISQLKAKARRMAQKSKPALIVIDYLQLIRPSGKYNVNRTSEVTEISNGLKALAKELKVPVIALSQLNREYDREGGKQRKPKLSDLRDSGSIEQDADLVMFICPPNDGNIEALQMPVTLYIAKHRNGALKEIPLLFNKPITRFQTP